MNISNRPRHEKFILAFYNKVSNQETSSYEAIPAHVRAFLSHLDYEDIIKPFAAEDLKNGLSRRKIALKYGVSRNIARKIGRNCGVFEQRKGGAGTPG